MGSTSLLYLVFAGVFLNPLGFVLLVACIFLGRALWKLPMYAGHNGRFTKLFPGLAARCVKLESNKGGHFAATFVAAGLVFVLYYNYNVWIHTLTATLTVGSILAWILAIGYFALMGVGLYHIAEDVYLVWNSKWGRSMRGAVDGARHNLKDESNEDKTPPADKK